MASGYTRAEPWLLWLVYGVAGLVVLAAVWLIAWLGWRLVRRLTAPPP